MMDPGSIMDSAAGSEARTGAGTWVRLAVSGLSRDSRQLRLPDGVAVCAGAGLGEMVVLARWQGDSGRRPRVACRSTCWSHRPIGVALRSG